MSARRVRVIAAIRARRPAAAALEKLQQRRDVELENVAGAARAAAAAWRTKPALVIFEATDEPERPAAGAGAFDAIRALRAEASSRQIPVLVLVPPDRADLREQAFAAGASDVCFIAPGLPGFEEALLLLAGIPARRWLRRPAAIDSRVSLPATDGKIVEVDAIALNLSGGGVQLRWPADAGGVPDKGAVIRVEVGRPARLAVFACVQGGTRAGDVCLTRLRFVGLTADERARLEALVDELPGPGEAEPEATPLPPDDADDSPALPPRNRGVRVVAMAVALLALVALVAGANALRERLDQPLPEPAHAAVP